MLLAEPTLALVILESQVAARQVTSVASRTHTSPSNPRSPGCCQASYQTVQWVACLPWPLPGPLGLRPGGGGTVKYIVKLDKPGKQPES